MILHALNGLYDRLVDDDRYAVAPPGYSRQKVTFKVVLTPAGDLVDFQDVRTPTGRGLRPVQLEVLGETKPSGSGLNPCFLWDSVGYLVGYRPEDPKPERSRTAFAAFRDRHLALEGSLSASVRFGAVCRFLQQWDPALAVGHHVLDEAAATGFGVFQIQGEAEYVHDDPVIRAWWDTRPSSESEELEGQCLVTGRSAPLARLHGKIRGVAGATGAGAPIVGFNERAYESYGKEAGYNAPVSGVVAHRYVTALNALLDGPRRQKHRIVLGDTTVAFWTERPTVSEDLFIQFAQHGGSLPKEPGSEQDERAIARLAAFLEGIRTGRAVALGAWAQEIETPYFLLGLSPNAGRVSVRFFHQSTLADLLDKLHRHHRDIALTPRPAAGKRRADPEFPSPRSLLRQTARDPKDIPPILAGPLLKSIVAGRPYPMGLFTAVLRRIRADRRIDYLRCCVIKGILNRNLKRSVDMSLDERRLEPAYRLGRLFAALEKTQRDALGANLNKTIRDSYYSSASSTPGMVFPRLLRTYQHHLGKLERGRIGRERVVQEILSPLEAFPSHLDLADQGLFALGYYHQNEWFYTKRDAAAD